MKKKFEWIKTLQLVLYVLISAAAIAVIFLDSELYQMVGRDRSVGALCLLLWAALALSFVGIYWDFATHHAFKKDYRELDYIVHNDHIAGIANRYTCDAMIEKYVDKPLPNNIGCIILDLSNLRDINEIYGHVRGNDTILEFSNILHTASLGLCFVGRNGGNKFMALFENCDAERLNTFLARVTQQVEAYNAREDMPRIEYRIGCAYSADEHVTTINRLIALSDSRLYAKTDAVTGFANRASCDDIINQYIDKEVPETLGCVMLDIVNIREINDRCGRAEGNRAIRRFADILRQAADGKGFVGRNGGTKFLALLEDCTAEELDAFITDVTDKTNAANAEDGAAQIAFRYGAAYQAKDKTDAINCLVALSDRRLCGEKV